MATTATSGVASSTSTWVGGVLPVLGEKIQINHELTIDGTYRWGDNSATAININAGGTLKFSRIVDSKLTCYGELNKNGGTLDMGTEADPILVNADLELNDSDTPAHNKWGFSCSTTATTGGVRIWGDNRTRETTISAPCTSTDTIIPITDVTGWKVGDVLVFDYSAEVSVNSHRVRKISAINGNNITISGNLGQPSVAGRRVLNISSNVRIYGKNGNTYRTHFSVYVPTAFTEVNAIEIGPHENLTGGHPSDVIRGAFLSLFWQSTNNTNNVVKKINGPVLHNYWSVTGSTNTLVAAGGSNNFIQCFGNQGYRYSINNAIFSSSGGYYGFQLYQGAKVDINYPKGIRLNGAVSMGYSQGPVACTLNNANLSCLSNVIVGTGISLNVTNSKFHFAQQLTGVQAMGVLNYTNCDFGSVNLNSQQWVGTGAEVPQLFDNCTFPSGVPLISSSNAVSNIANAGDQFYFRLRNYNGSTLNQSIWRKGGKITREAVSYKGLSVMKMSGWFTGIPIFWDEKITLPPSSTKKILGYVKYNGGTPPTINVQGVGISTSFTAPATTGAWLPVVFNLTNSQSTPNTITLTFSYTSTGDTSECLWAGLPITDFVEEVRHYGYLFDALGYRTTNPYITETNEATVSGYTGISINHTTQTITLSSPHSIKEVYDFSQLDLVNNPDKSTWFTTDGSTYTSNYNIVNNSTLSGSGALITTGTYTGSGSTTLAIKDSIGVRCKIRSGGSIITIKGASIAYTADVIEKEIIVSPSTNVTFAIWRLGYKPSLITINSGLLGGTYDVYLPSLSGIIDTTLDVSAIIAITTTTVDGSGYHTYFSGNNIITQEQTKATLHRLMKYENYLDAMLSTGDDSIVTIEQNQIKVAKPLFTVNLPSGVNRTELQIYLDTSGAKAITPSYIINPSNDVGLYVNYIPIPTAIDPNYLGQVVWENEKRTLTESVGSGGGGGFSSQAIQTSIGNAKREIIEKIGEIPSKIPQTSLENIETKLNENLSQIDIAKEEIIDTIKSSETEVCSDIIRKNKELKEDNVKTRNLVRQKTKKIDENVSKLSDRQDLTDKLIEDEANEIEASLEQIYKEEADSIERDLEDQYKKEAQEIENEINS